MRTAEHVRYLVLAAQREGNRTLTTLLSHIDLTPAQSEALRIVADHGPLALKELGDMLVCDSGTSPSRIVERLVAAGLVDRDVDENDRRQVRLTASPLGRDRAASVRDIEDKLYDVIDGALGPEDADTLIRVLGVLTQGSPAGAALDNRLAREGVRPTDVSETATTGRRNA